jgi:hypothetical protein
VNVVLVLPRHDVYLGVDVTSKLRRDV